MCLVNTNHFNLQKQKQLCQLDKYFSRYFFLKMISSNHYWKLKLYLPNGK